MIYLSPFWTSPLTGIENIYELLTYGHNGRIEKVMHMKKATFETLFTWAQRNNSLKAFEYLTCNEQISVFSMIINQGLKYCVNHE